MKLAFVGDAENYMHYFFNNRILTSLRVLFLALVILSLSACVENPIVEPPPVDPPPNPVPEAKLVDFVDGYTNKLSFEVGEELGLFINAKEDYENGLIELFDVRGNKVSQTTFNAKTQEPKGEEPWSDGFGYELSGSYNVPELTSGMYLWGNKIPFLVRTPNENVDITVLWASNTMNAYICSGGKNLYNCGINDESERPHQVSFQRPLMVRNEFYKAGLSMVTDWEGHSMPFSKTFKANV